MNDKRINLQKKENEKFYKSNETLNGIDSSKETSITSGQVDHKFQKEEVVNFSKESNELDLKEVDSYQRNQQKKFYKMQSDQTHDELTVIEKVDQESLEETFGQVGQKSNEDNIARLEKEPNKRIDERIDFKNRKNETSSKFKAKRRYQKNEESARTKPKFEKKLANIKNDESAVVDKAIKKNVSNKSKTSVSKLKRKNGVESKTRKLQHSAKEISYSTYYAGSKYNQLDSTKDTDDNIAITASEESLELIKNVANKRRSKLKFDGVKNQLDSSRVNTSNFKKLKEQSKKQAKFQQRKSIKKNYSITRFKSYNTTFKDRLKVAIGKAKEWLTRGFKKLGILLIGPVFIFAITSVLWLSLVQSFSSGVSTIISTSYQVSDLEVTNAETIYMGYETDLRYAIENVESDYPSYNEYRYYIDGIEHDPHMLLAYLTAKFGEFADNEARNELRTIFNLQYDYDLIDRVETRTRTVSHSSTDPETGQVSTWTSTETYNWYVLLVSLDTANLEYILLSRLSDDGKELFTSLMETKGNFQSLPSPFKESWENSVSSMFGYRLDPISGNVTFHSGIDLAKPTGTEMIALFSGKVIAVGYEANGLGHYLVLESEKGEKVVYGHCDSIISRSGDSVVLGQVISRVGSSGKSTGPHLHLELWDSQGNKLNPYFYLSEEIIY